jgi:hypothetical protein
MTVQGDGVGRDQFFPALSFCFLERFANRISNYSVRIGNLTHIIRV